MNIRALTTTMVAGLLVGSGWATTANAASGWQPTGSMSAGRGAHGAALLTDGRVLVVSGFSLAGEVPQSELYDPATETWSLTSGIGTPRHYATATTLFDGRVLVAGGRTDGGVTMSAELYNPVTDVWTSAPPMLEPRNGHTAVRLNDGRVLVTGGSDSARSASATAEVYDPAANTWSSAGNVGQGRENHQATLLANGRVLITGGYFSNPSLTFLSSSAIYDPATNSWTPAASMATPRGQMAGALLPDGTVLTTNGVNRNGFVSMAERFDPATGAWSSAGVSGVQGNIGYGAVLRDGRFLMTIDGSKTTPLYDPAVAATGSWSSAYASSVTRSLPSITRLADGRVLLVGGGGPGGVRHTSAELFTPPTERGSTGGPFAADLGDADEQDMTLSNDGANPLWIDGTDLTGDDADAFSVVADGCADETLEPDETCVVRVRFTPSAVRSYAAQLTVDDNAEASPATELTGEGRAKPVDPDPPVDPGPPSVPLPPSEPRVPAPPGPPSCSQPYLVLVGITATGSAKAPQARLTGLATPSLAGRTVTVLRGRQRVGSARVAPGGTVTATVRAPKGARARGTARYRLSIVGAVDSAALKATRRVATAKSTKLSGGRVLVAGQVAGVRRPTTLHVRSAPVCGPKVRGVQVRTDSRGRFRVTLNAPPSGVPAVVHRVWLQNRSVTLPILVAAKR